MNEKNAVLEIEIADIEELEGKIAPDSGQWDPTNT
jgi:hypothetical protein